MREKLETLSLAALKDIAKNKQIKNISAMRKKELIERGVYYIADFVYYRDGEYVVEDAKGVRTKEYIIKRKLMLYVHGIKIKEV